MNLPDFLTNDDGHITLSDHRISLVDVIYFYRRGESPEMLHLRFPTISLSTLHRLIAFYLDNEADVNEYVNSTLVKEEQQRELASAHGPTVEEMQRRKSARQLARGA
jgi:uncharacterized protein (DUF433 family)